MGRVYPKYSVLMSVYRKDNPGWLKESIDCMLRQTIKPSEFVIVCDGALTPELDAIIELKSAQNNIFKIKRIKENVGLGPALAIGVKECTNGYIARMDADDYSPDDRIEKQLNFLITHPEVDIIGSNAVEFIGDINNAISHVILPEWNNDIVKFSKKRCPYRHSGIIYKKESVIAAGNYRNCYLCEDYDLYARMEKNGCNGHNLQESLLFVRVNEDFYKRRGGIKYLRSIIKFKKNLKTMGFYTWKDFFIGATVHTCVCMSPNFVRRFFYNKALRHKNA